MMLVWIVQSGEELPGIDPGAREWRCSMLAKALIAKGHNVLWWGSTFNHVRKTHRYSSTQTIEIMPGWEVRLLHGPGYKRSRSLKRVIHHRTLAASFAREAHLFPKPDIIFASLPIIELAEQAVMYAQQANVPVIVDIRDLWPDHYLTLVPRWFRGVFRLVLFSEFRRTQLLLRNATGITAISSEFLNWGLNFAGRQRRSTDQVFPMGYPSSQVPREMLMAKQKELIERYGIDTNKLIVVFVGTINSIFDFDTIIQAARLLQQEGNNNIQFVVVGDGSHRKNLYTKTRYLNNVVLTGWLDHISVSAMLHMASVGLAPYAEEKSVSGSLPNKAFEYMAFGLPILSSHRGDLERLILNEQIGLHYQAGDVDSLIQSLRRLINNPHERQEMSKRSQTLYNTTYRPEVIYSRMVEFLEKITHG